MTMGKDEEEPAGKEMDDIVSDDDVIRADSDDESFSPSEMTNLRYNLSRGSLTSMKQQARQLVINVREYFKKERANQGPLLSPERVLERTCAALKLKDAVVVRLTKPNSYSYSHRQDFATRLHPLRIDAIKNFIALYYQTDPGASMMKAYQKILKSGLFTGSHTSFRRMLHRAGFQFVRGRKRLDSFQKVKAPFIFEGFLNDSSNDAKVNEEVKSGEEDAIKLEVMPGLVCEKDDLHFFQSLLPAVSKLSDEEKMKFRLAVMNKMHSLLYEPSK